MAEDQTESLVSSVAAHLGRHSLTPAYRLGLFIVNTIFAMQFNQILQITQEDPLIANRYEASRCRVKSS